MGGLLRRRKKLIQGPHSQASGTPVQLVQDGQQGVREALQAPHGTPLHPVLPPAVPQGHFSATIPPSSPPPPLRRALTVGRPHPSVVLVPLASPAQQVTEGGRGLAPCRAVHQEGLTRGTPGKPDTKWVPSSPGWSNTEES